jgi:hypothetical protein
LIGFVIAAIIAFRLISQILRSDKSNPLYGIACGVAAGIIAFGIHGLIDVNTNVLIPAGSGNIYFAVPFIWLLAAFLVVSHQAVPTRTQKLD